LKYSDKLENIISKNNSNLLIGLDSDINKIPAVFLKFKNPILEFNKFIVENTSDLVAGYKINSAFYECMLQDGFNIITDTVKFIPDECIKIGDVKRGDIPNTNKMYAKAYFDEINFDAITYSPYMGIDGMEVFLKNEDKFLYVLSLTSNYGAEDFQMQEAGGMPLYELVINKTLSKFGNKNVGFVFGANNPQIIRTITKKYYNIILLIPGIGAQGNKPEDLIPNICNNLFLINSSRNIIYTDDRQILLKEYANVLKEKSQNLSNLINSCKTVRK
jgi:orotidine-5'-phosphate decarboxylase